MQRQVVFPDASGPYISMAATRYATHAERRIEGQGAARDNWYIQRLAFAKTHDGTFAVLLFDLRQGETERPLFFRH